MPAPEPLTVQLIVGQLPSIYELLESIVGLLPDNALAKSGDRVKRRSRGSRTKARGAAAPPP